MNTTRVLAVRRRTLVILAWVCLAGGLRGEEVAQKEAFQRAAGSDAAYPALRDILLQPGDALRPLLEAKLSSDDWRERMLARALAMHLDEPDETALRLTALLTHDWRREFDEEGRVVCTPVALTPEGEPDPRVVILDRASLPLLFDWHRCQSPVSDQTMPLVVQLAVHWADAQSVPYLLWLAGDLDKHRYPSPAAPPEDDLRLQIDAGLAGLGVEIIPQFRAALERAGGDPWDPAARLQPAQSAAMCAARVLALMDDRSSAPLIFACYQAAAPTRAAPTFARALARLQYTAALPALGHQLVELARQCRTAREGERHYPREMYLAIREALVDFGDGGQQFFRLQAAADGPLVQQIVAGAVLRRLDDAGQTAPAEPAPLPLLLEGALISPMAESLIALVPYLEDRQARRVLIEALPQVHRQAEAVLSAVASSGHEHAVEVLAAVLEESPQLAGAVAVAAFAIVDRAAADVNQKIIDREEESASLRAAAEIARALRPALAGDFEALIGMLDHGNEIIRAAAARRLGLLGDVRAVPALLQVAQESNVFHGAEAAAGLRRSGGGAPRAARNAVLQLGPPAVASLREIAPPIGDDPHRAILCTSLVMQIERPQLVARLHEAVKFQSSGHGNIMGPSVADYRNEGHHLADTIDASAVPIVEAELLFGHDGWGSARCAFALARWKQERSVPIVVAAMRGGVGWARGEDVLSAALAEFGPLGVEAAKIVPRPDPDLANVRGRRSRALSSADVLVAADDPQAVEKILAGLNEPPPLDERPGQPAMQAWRLRVLAYLRLAARSPLEDERFVEPAIRLARHAEDDIASAALTVLAPYRDERIVALCLDLLGADERLAFPALELIQAQRGDGTAALLAELLIAAQDVDETLRLLNGARLLGPFGRYPHLHVSGIAFEQQQRGVRSFALLRAPLISRLGHAEASVRLAAARAVAAFGPTAEPEVLQPICGGVATLADPPQDVLAYLTTTGQPAAGAALHESFRLSDGAGIQVARALGQLQYVEALPDLVAADEARLRQREEPLLLQPIGAMGRPGLEFVLQVLERQVSLASSMAAAEILADGRFASGADAVDRLIVDLVEQHRQHPLYGALGRATPDPDHALRELETRYRGAVTGLLTSLGKLDADMAARRAARLLVDVDDPELAAQISSIFLRSSRREVSLRSD